MKQTLVNALRKGTNVIIGIDSHTIVLTPHIRVKKPGGVYDLEPQPDRAPQEFYVEPVGATLSGMAGTEGGVTRGEGGVTHKWDYELVGRWDSAMEIGDTWTHDGTIYQILAIKPENHYERRGVVSAIGKAPSYGA